MKNWKEYDPTKIHSNRELQFDHAIVHSWWNNPERRPEGCTLDDIRELHEEIVSEMERRGIKHETPLSFDIEKYDPSKVGDKQLLDDHRIAHAWWVNVHEFDTFPFTKDQIKSFHDKVANELVRRGFKHETPILAFVHSVETAERDQLLHLEDVLQYYKQPIIISKGFIKLVGGLANRGATEGDIDILIRWPEDTPNEIVHPIKFRLGRALPKEISQRIQFLMDEFHGPFTSHVPLYDLVLVPTDHKIVMMTAGIYLVPPHARFIAEGKKTLIVKTRPFMKYLGEEVYLIEDDKCYGIIRITDITGPYTKEELDPLQDEHCITDEEWVKWWKDEEEFWLYEFELIERYDPPKDVRVPPGVQTWIRDVKLQLRDPVAERQARQSRKEDKIAPLRFLYPLKTTIGYHEGEIYDIEQVLAWFKHPEDYPVSCEKKYDGLRVVWMKDNDKIIARSDDGIECTHRFPTLVEMLKKLPVDTITLDSEVEGWVGEKHIGREETAGYVHRKDEPNDSRFVVNVFDVLYVDGLPAHHEIDVRGDLHKQQYAIRRRVLEYVGALGKWQKTDMIPETPGWNIVPLHLIETPDPKRYKIVLTEIRNLPGSEGVMLKSMKADYPLTGHTSAWVKYKKSADLHVIVLERIETRTPEVYNYKVGLLLPAGWKAPTADVREIKLKNDKLATVLYVGKTFNTKIKAKPGDILTVMPHTLFVYEDGKVRIYEAPVYELRPAQILPDTVEDAIKIAKAAKIIRRKELGKYDVIVAITCSKTQGKTSGRPKDVYLTDVHQAFFDFCEDINVPYGVMSHKYGFVLHNESIDPYDEEGDLGDLVKPTLDRLKELGSKYLIFYDRRALRPNVRDFVERLKNEGRRFGIKVLHALTLDEIHHLYELAVKYVMRETREFAKRSPYTLQWHIRGGSVHADLRIKTNDKLEGFTLAIQEEDLFEKEAMKHWVVERPRGIRKVYWEGELYYVYDMRKDEIIDWNRRLDKQIFDWHKKVVYQHPEWWKIDLKTGRPKVRKPGAGIKPEREPQVEKIWCTPKKDEPVEWLRVEGIFPPREIEPIPGGTRFWPGIFFIVDEGHVYLGAQKPYFKEYFFDGKLLKGRYVFRLVNRGGRLMWLLWKTEDEIPYVITKRAKRIGWMPPLGESAMSTEWERKVPDHLRWWKAKTKEEAKRMRNEFMEKYLAVSRWLLQYQWWRGPIIIRRGPTKDIWIARFILDDGVYEVQMTDDPREGKTSGIIEKTEYDEFWDVKDKVIAVPPRTKYNPTKETPSYLVTVESGKVKVLEREPLFWKIDIGANRTFIMKRADPTENIWEVWVDVGSPVA